MNAKFNSLNKILRIVLLVIPFCNWIVELVLRWSLYLESKKSNDMIMAILSIFFGAIIGWVDVVFLIINNETFTLKD
ncbi:MAG: hypothetical protein MJ227_04295 [Bacilli bacterium]|nr:hypothetical protein [Bacilli bacterium]